MFGSVTRQKVCQPPAPSTRAASSSSVPWACIRGISSRATKGNVTNSVASTMPGTAKMILHVVGLQPRPEPAVAAEHQHEDQPGNHRRNAERQVDQRDQQLLPRNSNLAMAQAAATPKTVLSGTTIGGREQRQADGRQGVRIDQGPEVRAEPLRQRLVEHRHQRHHQEQRPETPARRRSAASGPPPAPRSRSAERLPQSRVRMRHGGLGDARHGAGSTTATG